MEVWDKTKDPNERLAFVNVALIRSDFCSLGLIEDMDGTVRIKTILSLR